MKTLMLTLIMTTFTGFSFAEDAGPTPESQKDGKPGNSISEERNKGQQGERMREEQREKREARREERAERRKEREEKREERRRAKKGAD